jgi:hypothetical protein
VRPGTRTHAWPDRLEGRSARSPANMGHAIFASDYPAPVQRHRSRLIRGGFGRSDRRALRRREECRTCSSARQSSGVELTARLVHGPRRVVGPINANLPFRPGVAVAGVVQNRPTCVKPQRVELADEDLFDRTDRLPRIRRGVAPLDEAPKCREARCMVFLKAGCSCSGWRIPGA